MAKDGQPISEERIWDEINDQWSLMDFRQRRMWDIVKIMPEKWGNQQKHYAHGSWVVAIIGDVVVWYDDIEEEFARSLWAKYGIINAGRYCAGSGELRDHLRSLWMRFAADDIGTPFHRG
ncbi:hypothetical protein KX729_07680 [Rhizobium sp. XQZ8]|uniref:hypothetical protein n=1 Tax=Rhizobium populisoli TaxID=2859785 RepID=UPI001CA55509|nr:hypothetical protein [Rhizobium populisoli]MBW6421318.1 hypothetical protein [Rhizobium populisoli]